MQTISFTIGHKARRKQEGRLRPTSTDVSMAIRPDQPQLCVAVYDSMLYAMYFSAVKSVNAEKAHSLEVPLDAAFAKSLTGYRLEEMVKSAIEDSQGNAALCMTMLETMLGKAEDLFKRRSAGSLKAAETRRLKATAPQGDGVVSDQNAERTSVVSPGDSPLPAADEQQQPVGDGKTEDEQPVEQPVAAPQQETVTG